MKAIKCEMCDSSDIVKQGELYVCQRCGTKYEPEAAKKLIVEIQENSEADLLVKKAEAFEAIGDSRNAEKVWQQVRNEYPYDARGWLERVKVNCKKEYDNRPLIDGNIREIEEDINRIEKVDPTSSCLGVANDLLINYKKNNAELLSIPYEEWEEILRKYPAKTAASALSHEYFQYPESHSNWVESDTEDYSYRDKYKITIDMGPDAKASASFSIEKGYLQVRGRRVYSNSVLNSDCWVILEIDNWNELKFNPSEAEKLIINNGIKQNNNGCYVATCIYGTYDCPQVWSLRRYRDYKLAKTRRGRAFIKTYYAISPTIVKWFGNAKWFKNMWQGSLDKLVAKCKAKGFKDTPYDDINW